MSSTEAVPSIDVKGMTKSFGTKTVVDGISMRVLPGEIYGFVGPNGSGKTTFLRMLCGLLKPDEGTGTCLGFDILKQSREIKRRVGYMTQRFSYYEDLTIAENLNFVGRMYGVPNRREAVDQALERLHLADRRKQLAGQLSGGWKQRLALAACMLHEPQLLLLDEPTAGVDPGARREFWEQIHQLAARGLTVLITTHYMDEAERCHRLAYIASGHLIAEGTVAEVIHKARLVTYEIIGGNQPDLVARLRSSDAITQVVAFGNSLHVSGSEDGKIQAVLRNMLGEEHQWRQIPTELEDVFIDLMRKEREEHRP